MADRLDYFFRQRVTEAELDLAFEQLEQADRNLAADIGVYGVVSGAVPAPHSPVADLSIDLTAPGRAYDHLGQRIFFGTGQTVDCSVDLSGIPTDVGSAGNERWLGVFLRFRRLLSDPRTDGNSQQVYFRRDESFEIVVRQGAQGAIGAAPRVALVADELLVCDVRRRAAQTQIIATDLDTSRRQAFVFAQGTSVALSTGLWSILQPSSSTAQAAFDETDAELQAHFSGAARRHPASAIDVTPHGFVAATSLQAALNELIDDLAITTAGSAGAIRVGADGVAGIPNTLAPGSVDSQLAGLLGFLNNHQGAFTGAHAASAISAQPFGTVAAANVQAQLFEIVSDYASDTPGPCGADLIGLEPISGNAFTIGPTSVKGGFIGLIYALEAHTYASSGAHAASAVGVSDGSDRLNATNVEDALNEIGDAFEDDHFRGNEGNAGMHRVIRQPMLGLGKVLIWESIGNNSAGSHLRLYLDDEGAWFVFNAEWSGGGWQKQTLLTSSGGLRIGNRGIEVLYEGSTAIWFASWTRTLRIVMNNVTTHTGFEATGAVREVGRCGGRIRNAEAGARQLANGHGVTFRSRFPANPSSLTFTARTVSPNIPTVAADSITVDGFGFWMTATVAATSSVLWFGDYIALS